MQNRTSVPREQRPPIPDFDPVPRKYRHDGWTPERQRAFIDALAATGSVSKAAKAVNMSPEGAYYLRRQPGAESFRRAWAAALDLGVDLVEARAIERAVEGVAIPHFYKGEQVGEHRVHNERLTMWILQHRKPEKYGSARGGTKAPETRTREAREAQEGVLDAQMALALEHYRVLHQRAHLALIAGNRREANFSFNQAAMMELILETDDNLLRAAFTRIAGRAVYSGAFDRPRPRFGDGAMGGDVLGDFLAALREDGRVLAEQGAPERYSPDCREGGERHYGSASAWEGDEHRSHSGAHDEECSESRPVDGEADAPEDPAP